MHLVNVTLLGIERKKGTNDDGVSYAHDVLHVLDGLVVHKARYSDSWPKDVQLIVGEVFSASVSVSPWAFNNAVGLSVRLLAPMSDHALASA